MRLVFFTNICQTISDYIKTSINRLRAFTKRVNAQSVEQKMWEQNDKIMTYHYMNMTMHVAPTKTKQFVWQLGNDRYFERGYVNSEEDAKLFALQACLFYIKWDVNNVQKSFFTDEIWKSDNSDGFIARWSDYDFWISPITSDANGSLWRYDVYRDNETKCIQSGVTRDLDIARSACIRIVEMLSFQQKLKSELTK